MLHLVFPLSPYHYPEKWPDNAQKSSQKIISLMTINPQITTQEIADELGVSRRAITKQITNLREQGIIRRVGPDKGGHWEVIIT
ncbi:MAG: HTH domain-containing protein [Bacteroidaceae bacterium]|nr:HTH domain-containing protein [Bacteroidaceae bacterium]